MRLERAAIGPVLACVVLGLTPCLFLPMDADIGVYAVAGGGLLALALGLLLVPLCVNFTRARQRIFWYCLSAVFLTLAIGTAWLYKQDSDALLFSYPDGRHYAGGRSFTEEATEYLALHPSLTVADLVAEFGGPARRGHVFTAASLRAARTTLLAEHGLFVLGLSAAGLGLFFSWRVRPRHPPTGLASAAVVSMAAPAPGGRPPTLRSLRRLLDLLAPRDADLEAFTHDSFPAIHKRFGSGMERMSKANLLLELADPADVHSALAATYLDEYAHHKGVLEFE